MALAARSIPPRLDPAMDYRPWFMLRGTGGIPATCEHSSWDLGDMTGRYLEGLILARRMGITDPDLSRAEDRLTRYLFKLLGPEGYVRDPQSGARDHTFSQGSAMSGLLALFEDSGDPEVRRALERLISAQLANCNREGSQLIDTTVKLPESSGSHLAGYQIYPAIRFYELTGCPDALKLAEGLSRWALADPVLGPNGEILKPLSWEGHIHSWFETLAGCARTARVASWPDREEVIERCRAVYDWVRRSNATSFGWFATYPTGGSCETCAISSAMRLALEFTESGHPEYFDDLERFVRNQVIQAQFTDLAPFSGGTNRPTPLMLGTFDSQSMPNGNLGTRGGEDVGTLEGCCLNGGMRALSLAWNASQTGDENTIKVNLALTRAGPFCDVVGYQPELGRLDITTRRPARLQVRIPPWADLEKTSVLLNGQKIRWTATPGLVSLDTLPAGSVVTITYPLREATEEVVAGGQKFRMTWTGDCITGVSPKGERACAYSGGKPAASAAFAPAPDTWFLQDAAGLAAFSMLARTDLERDGQPFFRIFPFANPPRADHEKWDDGDMTGRYVEALALTRRITGAPIDARERLLRNYLVQLFDLADGLCYTRQTEWTPRRACLFSQSSAMLGLLAWHRETGSAEALKLLEWQFEGLSRIIVDSGTAACFPKYEFDGSGFIDEPAGKDAPPWYGGRLILPLVEYWKMTDRQDVKTVLTKMIRQVTEVSSFIGRGGEVERGEGWWGHLHSTMDMAAGIAEFGRLDNRPELVDWARRVYEWVGRTHTTRYGWVADVSGGRICESCAIASRLRLGLALYRAGAAEPFGEIDRYLRNQLLENQFVELPFLAKVRPGKQRTARTVYAGLDAMVRGTFQCWATANDRIGNDDVEGCGAGGGVQGLALALDNQWEWRNPGPGEELRIHLLFNRLVRARPQPPFTTAAPVAAELWSYLPYEGKVALRAHQAIGRIAFRIPDGADRSGARVLRGASLQGGLVPENRPPPLEGNYAIVKDVKPGEVIEVRFPLREFETVEHAAGVKYKVGWRGDWVVSLSPAGRRSPLYADRVKPRDAATPLAAVRYP